MGVHPGGSQDRQGRPRWGCVSAPGPPQAARSRRAQAPHREHRDGSSTTPEGGGTGPGACPILRTIRATPALSRLDRMVPGGVNSGHGQTPLLCSQSAQLDTHGQRQLWEEMTQPWRLRATGQGPQHPTLCPLLHMFS